ncbi:MAG: DUF4209 domain-containing protein [Thainema sp.]
MQKTARELVKGKTLFDALCSLVFEYSLIRTIEDLRSEAEQEMQIYKSHLIPMALVDREGKTKAISGKSKSDLENKMFEIARFYQQWYGLNFVVPACHQICSEHTLSLEDLSFIFDENSFIPQGREPIYAQGLLAGLKGDLLVATHLLIPQLENSLRHILKQDGSVASKRAIIQEDFTLGKILDSPDLLEVLSKDIIFALKGLLNEPMGSNLRNEICHGLFNYDQFFTSELFYFWWLTLHFCLVPVYKRWSDGNQDKS